jgi:hypothetical protein
MKLCPRIAAWISGLVLKSALKHSCRQKKWAVHFLSPFKDLFFNLVFNLVFKSVVTRIPMRVTEDTEREIPG